MLTLARRSAVVLVVVLLLPAAGFAQGAITGVVKDASGAVLPGVTVEAASSVLIEKTRSVITDDTGQYRIVDLRPGTYTVTFTLQGFSVVKREGIELSGDFVATVNGEKAPSQRAPYGASHAHVMFVESVGEFRCQIEQIRTRVILPQSCGEREVIRRIGRDLAASVDGGNDSRTLRRLLHPLYVQPRACAVTLARQTPAIVSICSSVNSG